MALLTESYLIEKASALTKRAYKSADSILLKSAVESDATREYDLFLSHSYSDGRLILGVKLELEEFGFRVCVDWIEAPDLDRTKVTQDNAERLRTLMQACRGLLFAVSDNSPRSMWMPWELGYFDGTKGKVAILPMTKTEQPETRQYAGQEYLSLYPYVSKQWNNAREEVMWVNETPDDYVVLGDWLDDEPFMHDTSWRNQE